jgi:hypothetical protein
MKSMANAGRSVAAGLVPGAWHVSHVLQTQQTGSVSQVESWSKLAREREPRPGGVLGWQSRPVWHRAGNPEQQRRKGRQQLYLLEGRPPSGAYAPVGRSRSWLKALRSNRNSLGREFRFGSELTVNNRGAPSARRFSPCGSVSGTPMELAAAYLEFGSAAATCEQSATRGFRKRRAKGFARRFREASSQPSRHEFLKTCEEVWLPTKDFWTRGLQDRKPLFEAMMFVAWKRRSSYAVSVRDRFARRVHSILGF